MTGTSVQRLSELKLSFRNYPQKKKPLTSIKRDLSLERVYV